MKLYRFFIQVYEDGTQAVGSFSIGGFSRHPILILEQCRGAANLKWLKELVVNASKSDRKVNLGMNTLELFVDKEECIIGYEGEDDEFETMNTSDLIQYLEDAILFVTKYETGGIPGLVPIIS